jgi:hypothetical protein
LVTVPSGTLLFDEELDWEFDWELDWADAETQRP